MVNFSSPVDRELMATRLEGAAQECLQGAKLLKYGLPLESYNPVREGLMRAWVLGWYAGMNGETNDGGKHTAADAVLAEMPELG